MKSLKKAIRATALTALTAAALAACTVPQDDDSRRLQEMELQAHACAQSIAAAPPESSIITGECRQSAPALAVLSAAQERYSQLENLTTDLSAKLEAAETAIESANEQLERNNARTAQAQQELFDAHGQITTQATNRIRSNMDTQSLLEQSSEDLAASTVTTVTTRIAVAAQLEEEWIARYTDLETRYNGLRDLLSQQGADLLTAQILLDQQKAEFDRVLANAIIEGTRKEREELALLQQQAQELHDAAQAALTQAILEMEEVEESRLQVAEDAATLALDSAATCPTTSQD